MKQINVGNWWGMFITLAGRLGTYYSMISVVLIAFFAYPSVSTFVTNFIGISFPFWAFLLVIIVLPFIAMVLEYIFGLASFVAFNNQQAYKHGNPMREDIEILKEDTRLIKEKLGIK